MMKMMKEREVSNAYESGKLYGIDENCFVQSERLQVQASLALTKRKMEKEM